MNGHKLYLIMRYMKDKQLNRQKDIQSNRKFELIINCCRLTGKLRRSLLSIELSSHHKNAVTVNFVGFYNTNVAKCDKN